MIENESSGGVGTETKLAGENDKRGSESELFPDATSHPNDWCLSPRESQSISDSVSLDSSSAALTPRSKFLKAKLAELREQRLRELMSRTQQNLPPQSEFVKNKIIAELRKIQTTKQQDTEKKVESFPIKKSSGKPVEHKDEEAADSDIESVEEVHCSPRSFGATEPTEVTTDRADDASEGPEEEEVNERSDPEPIIEKEDDIDGLAPESNMAAETQKVDSQKGAGGVTFPPEVAEKGSEKLDLVAKESTKRSEVTEEVSEETKEETTEEGVHDVPPQENEKLAIKEKVTEECQEEAKEPLVQPLESNGETVKEHIAKEKCRSRSRSRSRDGSRGHHRRRHEGDKSRGKESKRVTERKDREANRRGQGEHRQDSRSPDGSSKYRSYRDRDRDRDSSSRSHRDSRSRKSSRRESSHRRHPSHSPNRRRDSARERRRSSTRNKHKRTSSIQYNHDEEDQTMRRGNRRDRHSMSAIQYETLIEECPRKRSNKNESLAQLLFQEEGGGPIRQSSHRYNNHMSLRNISPPELIGYNQHGVDHDQLQNSNDIFLPVFHHPQSTNDSSGGSFGLHTSHQDTPELWTHTPEQDSPPVTSTAAEEFTSASTLPATNTSSTHGAAVAAAAAAAEAAAEAAQRAGAALVALKKAEAHQRDPNLSVAMAAAASASAAAATAAAAVAASLQQIPEEPESQQSATLRSTQEALSATVAASAMNLFHQPPPPPVQTFYGNF